jgi:AcrR family transcriptional regulator
MSPKAQVYSPELILGEALDLVREDGMAALSARSVAARLGCSVAPVYSAFGSMEGLARAVLDEAARLLDARIRSQGQEMAFLAMGVGILLFARDEERLFEALLEDGGADGRLARFVRELRKRLDGMPLMASLGKDRLDAIFDRMWIFTLGLASALRNGFLRETDDEALVGLMRSQGAIVTYGETLAHGEFNSPGFITRWKRALSDLEGRETTKAAGRAATAGRGKGKA